jgi:hypothetical protein
MSKRVIVVVYRQLGNFSAISWREQVNFQWDDDEICFVLDQHTEMDFYSASSLKQQSTCRFESIVIHKLFTFQSISYKPLYQMEWNLVEMLLS